MIQKSFNVVMPWLYNSSKKNGDENLQCYYITVLISILYIYTLTYEMKQCYFN